MVTEKTWEEETLELLREAEEERRRAEQRLAAAQRAVETADQRIAAIQVTLNVYRARYGLARVDATQVNDTLAVQFQNKTIREMLLLWAVTHGGVVVVDQAGTTLTKAGLFQSKRQASGSLHPTMIRLAREGLFLKVDRGRYQKLPETGQNGSSGTSARLVCPECGVPMNGLDPKGHALSHWNHIPDGSQYQEARKRRQMLLEFGGATSYPMTG